MEKGPEPSQAQPTPEALVQSIEGNGVASAITEGQWKYMMDLVLAIYDVREAE